MTMSAFEDVGVEWVKKLPLPQRDRQGRKERGNEGGVVGEGVRGV